MKSFRYYMTSLMMVLILGLSLSACKFDSHAQTNHSNGRSAQSAQTNDSQGVNKEFKDSLAKITARVDSLTKCVKEANNAGTETTATVLKLQEREKWLWISLVMAVLALIVAVYGIIKCYNLKGRADRQRRDIDNIVRKVSEASFNTSASVSSKSSAPSDYASLKKRVYELEYQVNQLLSSSRSMQSIAQPIQNPVIPDASSKNGYFANPIQASDPYFRKLLSSRDSEARFSVEIQGEKGYFKPLDDSSSYLNTLVSNDAMKAAIEFSGCQPPTEATSMRIIKPGEVVQKEKDGRWYITKKASVALFR